MNTDYLIAEYESLREEIMKNQERRVANERYGVAATMAVYVWLSTEAGATEEIVKQFLWFGWWLPFFLSVFGYFRQKAISEGIREAGAYLVKLQDKLDIEGLGWERKLAADREAGKKLNWVSRTSRNSWLAVGVATWVIAMTATVSICSGETCAPSALNGLFALSDAGAGGGAS